MRVALIIPARNEAAALRQVLTEIPRDSVHEILVVDNGSTDATAEVARQARVRVVTEPRAGYGRACLSGIRALDASIDTIVFMDADHADDPQDLPSLLAPIEAHRAELVIGSRVAQAEPGSLTVQQRLGNRLACALLRRCFGYRYTDLGPFRAIRREALERLAMRDQTFGWTVEMQAKAARARLQMTEVPVRYRRRIGRSKISGTVSGTLSAGWSILFTIGKIAFQKADASHPVSRRQLIVFLKEPQPGKVKTRLAATVGEEAAGALYRACIELTLERLWAFRSEAVLSIDPPEALARMRAWVGTAWSLRPQQGSTLGERLADATGDAFARGVQRLVVIGTDAPWVREEDVQAAFRALDDADVVLGPTEDGGYYLIGLSRCIPALFEGIAWSTASVYAQTHAKAEALGLRVEVVRPGYDLDHLEDVKRFVSEERRQGAIPQAVATIEALSQGRAP